MKSGNSRWRNSPKQIAPQPERQASVANSSNKAYFLTRSNVSFSAADVVLRVYRTKTIQFHQRVLEIPLPLIPNSILCSVFALKNYFSLAPAPLDLPLFMVSEGSGIKPVLASHFNLFFKACVLAAGFNPQHFSSRSFRQGGATFAFNCGVPSEFIKAQGDWQSDAYSIYLKLSTQKKLDILRSISTLYNFYHFFLFFFPWVWGYFIRSPVLVFNKLSVTRNFFIVLSLCVL